MKTLVTFDKVSKHYNGKKVVDSVNFSLKRGTITVLLGPNGAGKTTVVRIMLKLDNPTNGTVTTFPQNLKYSYLPQKIDINPFLPIDAKTLLSYLAKEQISNSDLLKEILEFANFDKIANQQILDLSGGLLRRLFIAATLAKQADLVVFDEPMLNLDLESQQKFYTLMQRLRKEQKVTILMISHDLHTVMRQTDQVLCLNHHICCSGKPEDFIDDTNQLSFYHHRHNHVHND